MAHGVRRNRTGRADEGHLPSEDAADPRQVMLSRWGQDFVAGRGMGDLWDAIREQCIDVAIADPEGCRMPLAAHWLPTRKPTTWKRRRSWR